MIPPRFACDVMLGKTAKWLRILGFDTFYDNKAADEALQQLCLKENRILLTKDVALHKIMSTGTSCLVATVHPRQQLKEIVCVFQLDRFTLTPRCSLCNGDLAVIDKEIVKNLVPPYVFRTQVNFQRCSRCKKIYWPGTHKNKIDFFMETIKKKP